MNTTIGTMSLSRLDYAVAAWCVFAAGHDFQRSLKAGFRPDEPRMPAGSPGAGQWTDDGLGTIIPANDRSSGRAQERGDARSGYQIDLSEEEAAGGHTVVAHVGRSRESLLDKVRSDRLFGIFNDVVRHRDGSFPSLQAANRLVNSTLSRNSAVVKQVASGAKPDAFVTANFSSKTGVEAFRPSTNAEPYIRDTYGVGVYIVHDPASGNGFRVVSAYPRND